MEYRETGMPEELVWEEFFDPSATLKLLNVTEKVQCFVDIGSGYGTFLIPASKMIAGKATGIDINEDFLHIAKKKIDEENITNIELIHGDISDEDVSQLLKNNENIDYICLFNILHCEEPIHLLEKAANLLTENGRIAVTHWIYQDTPRGPSLEIRPKPGQIIQWADRVGLCVEKEVELPPYHYGLLFKKK